MADALCGPSNALQDFKRATQVDRTLQQDRLISRQTPAQGFRSAGQNAGILDPEFEAFQAGHPANTPLQFDTRPFPAPNAIHSIAQQHPPLPDWASDFQRLHISSPAQPASSTLSPGPAITQSPAQRYSPQTSWHQDFMQSQHVSTFQQPQLMPNAYSDFSWEYGQAAPFSSVAQGKQRAVDPQESQFDAQAFAEAFEAATQDALAEEDAIAQEIADEREEIEYLIAKREAEETSKREASQIPSHLTSLDLAQDFEDDLNLDAFVAEGGQEFIKAGLSGNIIMQDAVHDYPQEQEVESKETDTPPIVDEELARTAGHLLDSVSHETSQKFQESVFLQLMRRIRDKEVRVDGDNFVETAENSGASTPALGGAEPMATNTSTQSRVTTQIPLAQNDSDLGRFGGEPDVIPLRLPSRPLTPDIDPPAPSFADWRQRLWNRLD